MVSGVLRHCGPLLCLPSAGPSSRTQLLCHEQQAAQREQGDFWELSVIDRHSVVSFVCEVVIVAALRSQRSSLSAKMCARLQLSPLPGNPQQPAYSVSALDVLSHKPATSPP